MKEKSRGRQTGQPSQSWTATLEDSHQSAVDVRFEADVGWADRLGRPQSVAYDRSEVFQTMEGPQELSLISELHV